MRLTASNARCRTVLFQLRTLSTSIRSKFPTNGPMDPSQPRHLIFAASTARLTGTTNVIAFLSAPSHASSAGRHPGLEEGWYWFGPTRLSMSQGSLPHDAQNAGDEKY